MTFIMSRYRFPHLLQYLRRGMLNQREWEHRPPTVKQTVAVPVPDTLPAQPLVEKRLEETTTVKENLPDDHPPSAFPSYTDAAEPEEPAYQLPQRERHPPRRITYDQLGIPSCYSIQPQPQLFPVYSAPGLVPWLPSLQQCYFQPPYMYGLQQT